MALPWPPGAPTIPRLPGIVPFLADRSGDDVTDRPRSERSPAVAQLLAALTSPVTALVVMLLGLALLFVLPLVGLPFVALVVLPAVIYQLGAERRIALRRRRR